MKKLVAIFIAFLLFQCASENNIENRPSNFLEKERFTDLIYEINVLEGNLSNFNLSRDVMKDSAMKLYKGVFINYDIDYKDFKENQDYYILTDQYKGVSQEVLDRLLKEQEKYKDLEAIKTMSLVQYNQLFKGDDLLTYMREDENSNFQERLDSVLHFYRDNSKNLSQVSVDSISFEINIAKLRKGRDLFRFDPNLKKIFNK